MTLPTYFNRRTKKTYTEI